MYDKHCFTNFEIFIEKKQFSGLGTRVFGEEDNEFKNKFGEKIVVKIQDTEEKTANLLSKVLDGNKYAAQ